MKTEQLKIRLVDGFKIRNTLDPDFGIFHVSICHESGGAASLPVKKFYIPADEWWLDYRHADELEFLLKAETMAAPEGAKTLTEWREHIRQTLTLPLPVPDFAVSREERENQKVVMVKGEIARQYLDPWFILGGHDLVYSYIPQGEIWLDTKMDPAEIPFVFHHEAVEREYMTQGKTYDIAHDYATAAEKDWRRTRLGTRYPLDEDYLWGGKTSEELAKEYYVK